MTILCETCKSNVYRKVLLIFILLLMTYVSFILYVQVGNIIPVTKCSHFYVITKHTTKTLLDNIYSNCTNFNDGISGNLTLAISDHLAQFLIIQEVIDKTSTKNNIYKRDYRKFDRENFVLDLLNIEWNQVITIVINLSTYFFDKIDSLVNQYIPLRKLTKKEIENKFKP